MSGALLSGAICIGCGVYASDWGPVVLGTVLIGLAGLLYAAGFRDGTS